MSEKFVIPQQTISKAFSVFLALYVLFSPVAYVYLQHIDQSSPRSNNRERERERELSYMQKNRAAQTQNLVAI